MAGKNKYIMDDFGQKWVRMGKEWVKDGLGMGEGLVKHGLQQDGCGCTWTSSRGDTGDGLQDRGWMARGVEGRREG